MIFAISKLKKTNLKVQDKIYMGSKQVKIKTIVKQKMNKPISLCLILGISNLHALKSIYLPINHFSILTFIEEYCKNSILDVLYCKYGFCVLL